MDLRITHMEVLMFISGKELDLCRMYSNFDCEWSRLLNTKVNKLAHLKENGIDIRYRKRYERSRVN